LSSIAWQARFGALTERPFRLLWLARTSSAVGDRMVPVALAFAVIGLGGSGTDLGLVLAAGLVPNVVFVLVGGVVGDRFDRTRVMLTTDVVRAVTQGTIAVLLLSHDAAVWNLAVSSAVWGAASAFFVPASTGVVPSTVSAGRLQQANALTALTRNAIGVGAPVVSGLLVASFGSGVVFAIDAASFVASAFFLLRLHLPKSVEREPPHFVSDLAAGWRELVARTWLWISIIAFSVWNLALAVFFVLGPLVFSRELGGARDWGLVMTGSSVGAVLGGTIALRWKPSHPLAALFTVTLVAPLQLLLLVPPAPAWGEALAALAAMMSVSTAVVLWTTTLQEQIPARALSRVSAYDWLGSLVAMPAGYALAGPISSGVGVDATLVGAACVMGGACLAALFVPSLRDVRRREEPEPETETVPERAAAVGYAASKVDVGVS
jgi:MFS family permease